MRTHFGRFAALVLCLAALAPFSPAGTVDRRDTFITLCYHDIIVDQSDLVTEETMPVWLTQLSDQFDWLRDNGYNVVGLDDVMAARRGERRLPDKAVLLSFDDGYASFYRFVFPLLRAHNYKAVAALETTWLETPADQPVKYGDYTHLPRSYFMTWEQIREVADSGLVELAGHTHNLHCGHTSMPQGVVQPSGATLAYDPGTKTYETPEEFYDRVKDDVTRNAEIIQARTGHRPRLLVWPYGHYKKLGVQASLDAGFEITATLGYFDDRDTISRFLMYHDITIQDVMSEIERGSEAGSSAYARVGVSTVYTDLLQPVYDPQRIMHVDLDYIYDPDPGQQFRNVSALFDRVDALGVSAVYLQAFSDPDGNGTADALYFPNRHLPMRADLFNYISWQLEGRYSLFVYAWLPVLGFEIPGRPLVAPSQPGKEGSPYRRLTPFDADNRRVIKEIYEDLALHSIIDGVLYHDDAIFGDYEDASPAGLAWLEEIGLNGRSIDEIRCEPETMRYFTRMKTKFLMDFTNELTAVLEDANRRIFSARNVYAPVVLNPASEAWFAQNFADFLDNYDYVALMAMPYMEGAADHAGAWLKKLAEAVKKYPAGPQKTVFELQAVDWREGHKGPVPSKILAEQMLLLQTNGIGNLGYYPEDPVANHPDINVIYPAFSLHDLRYPRKTYTPKPPTAAPEAVKSPRFWLPPDAVAETSSPFAAPGGPTTAPSRVAKTNNAGRTPGTGVPRATPGRIR